MLGINGMPECETEPEPWVQNLIRVDTSTHKLQYLRLSIMLREAQGMEYNTEKNPTNTGKLGRERRYPTRKPQRKEPQHVTPGGGVK